MWKKRGRPFNSVWVFQRVGGECPGKLRLLKAAISTEPEKNAVSFLVWLLTQRTSIVTEKLRHKTALAISIPQIQYCRYIQAMSLEFELYSSCSQWEIKAGEDTDDDLMSCPNLPGWYIFSCFIPTLRSSCGGVVVAVVVRRQTQRCHQ